MATVRYFRIVRLALKGNNTREGRQSEMNQKVEFIESYIKIGNGDYQWNDNYGELIRCKDCIHGETITDAITRTTYILCSNKHDHYSRNPEWFCADGERRSGDG